MARARCWRERLRHRSMAHPLEDLRADRDRCARAHPRLNPRLNPWKW